jgi:hypothetical protein
MFGKLALLASVELFVLIAAIFLLVYITKQQVSKWFTYSTVAIVITILAMMICTMCCVLCCRHCGQNRMQNECRFEEERCNKMMMFRMQNHEGGCPEEMMMHEGNCCKEKEGACEMKKECCEGKEGKMMKVDSSKKEVIIIKRK